MTTITDKKQYPSEQYLNELITNMEFAARAPVEVVRAMAAELQKRREADGAEPVAWVMADDLRDNAIVSTPAYPCLDDAKERTIGSLIALYAAPPVPVIQADVAQAIENLKQKLVECNRYNYCADAVKGVEDACHAAMLHGAEPVSQTYKLPPLSSSEVNDAAWKLHNMLTEHGPLNGRQFNNLKGCFYEALKVAMRNSPVTPDSWISCSERMPEKNQNVLISVNFDSSLVEPLICSARYTGSTFRRGDATIKPGNGIEQATHWMPLPEPPQEVNRG